MPSWDSHHQAPLKTENESKVVHEILKVFLNHQIQSDILPRMTSAKFIRVSLSPLHPCSEGVGVCMLSAGGQQALGLP
jgi:hypothetical protein